MRKKTFSLLFLSVLLISLSAGCGTSPAAKSSGASQITSDRQGNPVTIPSNIKRVISIGPANTEILTALGCGEKIIAVDGYSTGIPSVAPDLPLFDMMALDGERLIDLQPDVIIITGMTMVEGVDPLKPVSDAGVCVLFIPPANSINAIKDDIAFIAGVMGETAKGDTIIEDMEKEIESIHSAGGASGKRVYFEISAAPYMYSFGRGVFLNEMIEITGAENIFIDREDWLSVSEEAVLDANPDIIFTSVDYIDNPVGEIMSRPGWEVITAVANGRVYYIDADACSRASHNIIKALREMAAAINEN